MAQNFRLQALIEARDNASKAIKGVGEQAESTSDKLKNIGGSLQGMGNKLTAGVTLPLAGVGATALKMSNDFEDSAKQVASTANLAEDQIESLEKSVDEVATTTGESTDRIFSAMQKAVSGSLNLAESQELVLKTTKAAAAGFGDTERLVDITTTSFDLFNDQVENASEILDNLVRGAQSTQVNVEDMAGSFSRVASIGAGMNLEHRELIATLGVVAERMGDTKRAGRALTTMFSVLQQPPKRSAEIFRDLFGSMDNLHESMSKDLIGTLKELKKRLNANNLALSDVFGSTQSLDAANLLLADSGNRASEVLREVENSAGAVQDAFEKSNSTAREFDKLMQTVKSGARTLGDTIKETFGEEFQTVTNMIKGAVEAFKNMSPEQRKMIVLVLAIVAAIGPLLVVLGTLISAVGTIAGIISAPLLAALALVGAAVLLLKDNWEKLQPAVQKIIDIFKVVVMPLLEILWEQVKKLGKDLLQLFRELKPVLKVLGAIIGIFLLGAVMAIIGALTALVAIFRVLVKVVKWVVKLIVGLFEWLYDTLVGNSIIPDLINDISAWFNKLLDLLGSIVSNIVEFVVDKFKEMVNRAVNFISDLPSRIRSALSNLANVIARPFRDALDKVRDIADDIKDNLEKINPWHRESPSLVDNVQSGVKEIQDQFSALQDTTMEPINAKASFLSDSQARRPTTPVNVAGAGNNNRGGVTFNINMNGMVPMTNGAKREAGQAIFKEIIRAAESQNMSLQEFANRMNT